MYLAQSVFAMRASSASENLSMPASVTKVQMVALDAYVAAARPTSRRRAASRRPPRRPVADGAWTPLAHRTAPALRQKSYPGGNSRWRRSPTSPDTTSPRKRWPVLPPTNRSASTTRDPGSAGLAQSDSGPAPRAPVRRNESAPHGPVAG